MSLDRLPTEIRSKIVSHVDIMDLFSLVRLSRSWRSFISTNVTRFSKYNVSSLGIEQFDYVRFKFKAHAARIRDGKKTQLKNFFFRTENDLWLFLQCIQVDSSLYLRFLSSINLQTSLISACRNITTITFVVASHRTERNRISLNYLAQICEEIPTLRSLILEDLSDYEEDAYNVITKIKKPDLIEARSGKSNSKMKITDRTLLHLAEIKWPLDCIALSTENSRFSQEAVRTCLENAQFCDNGLLELFYVDCTTNEFFKLLSDMRVSFESEPIRGIYNSFPINLKGTRVCLNIKFFSDSTNRPSPNRQSRLTPRRSD